MSTTQDTTPETTSSKTAAAPVPKSLWQDALNAPNLITISRLLLAILLFGLIYVNGFWITSAILFLSAASTDFLDGYIARKYGMITILGRIMDPFVDKIIVGGAFIFLSEKTVTTADGAVLHSGVNAWMVIIVIGREMFVTSLRGYLEQQGRDFSASFTGKAKMLLQCLAVPLAILSLDARLQFDAVLLARDIMLWLAIAVTIYSGVDYVYRATKILKTPAEQDSPDH